jgi:hypothetical protein
MWYIVGNWVYWQTINSRTTNNISHAELPRIDLMLNYQANKLLVVQHQIESNEYIVGSSTSKWTTNNFYACLLSIRKILCSTALDILLVVQSYVKLQAIYFMLKMQELFSCWSTNECRNIKNLSDIKVNNQQYIWFRYILSSSAWNKLLVIRHQTEQPTIYLMLNYQQFIWGLTTKQINCL